MWKEIQGASLPETLDRRLPSNEAAERDIPRNRNNTGYSRAPEVLRPTGHEG